MNIPRVTNYRVKYQPKTRTLERFGLCFERDLTQPTTIEHRVQADILEVGAQFYEPLRPQFEVINQQGIETIVPLSADECRRRFLRHVCGKADDYGRPINNFSSIEEHDMYVEEAEKRITSGKDFRRVRMGEPQQTPLYGVGPELDDEEETYDDLPNDAWREEIWSADRMVEPARIRLALERNYATDRRTLIDLAYLRLKTPKAINIFIDWYLESLPAESHIDLICAKLNEPALSHYLTTHPPYEISPRTGNTIFISACLLGLTAIVQFYLANASREYIQHVNRRGVNGLMAAAGIHNVSLLNILINHFDLGVQDEQGFTALHHWNLTKVSFFEMENPLYYAMSDSQRDLRDIIGRTAHDLESRD